MLTQLCELIKEYPILRGLISYAITWPACSLAQEYLDHGKTLANADWARAARFCLFGAIFMSPIYYYWLKFSYPYFEGGGFFTAIARAMVEQFTYGPFSIVYFFFIMSLLEMQPLRTCVNEVKTKFWPTFLTGFLFWPAAQTINFYFISEENRLVFRSVASFIWTIYMGHMKSKGYVRRRRGRRRRGTPCHNCNCAY